MSSGHSQPLPSCNIPNENPSTQAGSTGNESLGQRHGATPPASFHLASSNTNSPLRHSSTGSLNIDPQSRESHIRSQSRVDNPPLPPSSNLNRSDLLPSTTRTPPTAITLGNATYASPGLQSATQMTTTKPPLYVSYGHDTPRSASNLVMQQTAVGLMRYNIVPDVRHGASSSNIRAGSVEEEPASSDDFEGSVAGSSAFRECDKYVVPEGSRFRCTYQASGRLPCEHRADKRHLITRHIKAVHLGLKPFKCEVCGKAFAHKAGLETHENTHTGNTPHHCPECNEPFSDRSRLHRHRTKYHGYEPRSRRKEAVFVSVNPTP